MDDGALVPGGQVVAGVGSLLLCAIMLWPEPARAIPASPLAPAGSRVLFVAGQAPTDAHGHVVAAGFVEQFARALENVLTVVREAGGEPRHIGRLTICVTDSAAYRASLKPMGDVYRSLMGRHYPAMALVEVSAMVDPAAMVEIEATAVL